jgi:hypothetical protein
MILDHMNLQLSTHNINSNSEKSTTYEKFVSRLHDRGITVREWTKANDFDRKYVWGFFKKGLGTKRGGIVAARLRRTLKNQGLINGE